MLNLEVLGSSSEANCYIIRTKEETLILECGMNYKFIKQALKFDLSKVKGCIITHEHKDHSRAAADLMKSGIDLYSSEGTFKALDISGHRVHALMTKTSYNIGRFSILPFDTEHDAAEPYGYLIYHPTFGKLLFATDTFYIKYKFNGLNYIMVECNYSKEILDENISAGRLHPALRKRLLKSHFSLENVKIFLQANDLSKVESIMLMHLSNGNSHAENFKNEIERLTGVPVRIC